MSHNIVPDAAAIAADSGGGTTNFLRADGTWAAPPGGGGGITELTGDVTASGTGSVAATIASDAVTYAKMQNVSAASRLLGRGSAGGAGDVEEVTLGSGLAMTGTTLSATGGGGTGTVTFSGNTASGSAATSSLSLNDLEIVLNIDGTDVVNINGATATFDVAPSFPAGIGANFTPAVDNTYDLGTSTYAWRDAYIDRNLNGAPPASMLFGAITNSTNSSNTVYAAVNGSNVTVEAGKTYHIRWLLRTYSAAATTAPRPRRILAGGAVGTVYGFHYLGQSNASAGFLQSSREATNDPFLATGNATSSTTASGSQQIECLFSCTTGGTIGLEFRSEVNTSLVTISGDGSFWVATVRLT